MACDLRFLVVRAEDEQRPGTDRRHGGEHRPQGDHGRRLHRPGDPLRSGRACGRRARPCSATAIDALVNRDARLAQRVCATGRAKSIGRSSRSAGEVEALLRTQPERVPAWLALLAVARNLERIADHAANIAEDVIYLVEGRIVRHENGSSPAPRLRSGGRARRCAPAVPGDVGWVRRHPATTASPAPAVRRPSRLPKAWVDPLEGC